MKFNGFKYSIVDNYKDAIDEELLSSKITDYYNTFDYIVGDWAYNKLRLKGFYEDSNPKALSYNKISTLDNYFYSFNSNPLPIHKIIFDDFSLLNLSFSLDFFKNSNFTDKEINISSKVAMIDLNT